MREGVERWRGGVIPSLRGGAQMGPSNQSGGRPEVREMWGEEGRGGEGE